MTKKDDKITVLIVDLIRRRGAIDAKIDKIVIRELFFTSDANTMKEIDTRRVDIKMTTKIIIIGEEEKKPIIEIVMNVMIDVIMMHYLNKKARKM